jgi:positive regulator of sigma E activity
MFRFIFNIYFCFFAYCFSFIHYFLPLHAADLPAMLVAVLSRFAYTLSLLVFVLIHLVWVAMRLYRKAQQQLIEQRFVVAQLLRNADE